MIDLTRRAAAMLLAASLAGAARGASTKTWPTETPLGPARPFSFDRLRAGAQTLARRPPRPPPTLPADLADALDYDAFGQIIYRPQAALWSDQPGDCGVRFFPIGRPAPVRVTMHVVVDGEAREILYSPALFDMPASSPVRRLGAAAGFAGFRVMNADRQTDWLAFLGASYFRSADPFNQYGLSARGLAIDTASPSPEEFPAFTAFWLERGPGDLPIIYALLEGPSVTGAYRIAHERSAAGLVQDIAADLNFRKTPERLGLAPLTSMYWYGQTDRTPADDWRPQIHDSDGLSIWTGAGERVWRPLGNPPHVITNVFQDHSPRGFGLMQRDRRFEDYQDDGVFFEKRPSAWVEPVGDWGEGSVQLVEIPTSRETDDNIVAFWTPAALPKAGQSAALRYKLHWTDEEPTPVGVAKVVATRSGLAGRPGQPVPPGRRKLVVDFAGGQLSGATRDSGVTAEVSSSLGKPIDPACYPVAGVADRWRLMFDLEVRAGMTIDLRAYLRRGGEALTETWISQLFG
jgi:glucans biosynthesis protein